MMVSSSAPYRCENQLARARTCYQSRLPFGHAIKLHILHTGWSGNEIRILKTDLNPSYILHWIIFFFHFLKHFKNWLLTIFWLILEEITGEKKVSISSRLHDEFKCVFKFPSYHQIGTLKIENVFKWLYLARVR